MADLILHKRSSTASAVPSAGSIALGELAINTADGRLFLKKGDGTVVDVTSIGGIQGLTAALAGKMTNPMTTAGDMIRGGASGAPQRVAAGTNGQVWTIVSGVPVWAAPSGGADAKQLCTAWVSFNGTGTVAIRDSYNVSSITDNGVGDYTVNFATAMANTNYAIVAMAGGGQLGGGKTVIPEWPYAVNPTISAARGRFLSGNNGLVDHDFASVIFFGGK